MHGQINLVRLIWSNLYRTKYSNIEFRGIHTILSLKEIGAATTILAIIKENNGRKKPKKVWSIRKTFVRTGESVRCIQ